MSTRGLGDILCPGVSWSTYDNRVFAAHMSRCLLCPQRLVGEYLSYGHRRLVVELVVESRHTAAGWRVYVQTGRVDEKVLACDFAVRENCNAKKRISIGHDGWESWSKRVGTYCRPGGQSPHRHSGSHVGQQDLRSIEVYTRQKRRGRTEQRGDVEKSCSKDGSDGIEALVLQVPISETGKIGARQLFIWREGKSDDASNFGV